MQPPAAVIVDTPRDDQHPARTAQASIPSGGVKLNGVFLLASGAGPHPVMLLLHGMPGTEQNFDLAHAARRAGWSVLIPHYRGAWGSPGRFGVGNALEDAQAAVSYLRGPAAAAEHHVDPKRLVIVGHSMGGLAAAACARRDEDLAALILLDPWNAGEEGRNWNGADAERRSHMLGAFGDLSAALAGATPQEVFDELSSHQEAWDYLRWAADLAHLPVLCIGAAHGLGADAERLARAMEDAGAHALTSLTLPSDHAFSDCRIALASAVIAWLQALD